MARFNLPINSFIAGEMSPNTRGRTDLQQYQQGCEEIYNMLVDVQGGASRRAGSINETIDSYNGTGYLNYISHLRGIDDLGAPTFAGPPSRARIIPFFASNGKRFLVTVIPELLGGSGSKFIGVMNLETNDLMTPNFRWGYNGPDAQVSRLITADQISRMQYAQAGDILVLVIPEHPPLFVFLNLGNTDPFSGIPRIRGPGSVDQGYYFYSAISIGVEQFPFLPRNVLNSQNQGTVTLGSTTAGALTTADFSQVILDNSWINTMIKVNSGTASSAFYITSIVNSGQATVRIINKTAPSVGPYGNSGTTSWEESAWSDRRGWPVSVTYHGQRLYYVMASGAVYASQIGNIYKMMGRLFEDDPAFTTTVVASDPYSFTIAAKEPPIGRWLHSAKNLQIGTLGREFISTGNSALEPAIDAESSIGSAAVQPSRIDNALYFVQRAGQSIRQLTYNNDEDAYQAADLNILSNHIVRKSSVNRSAFTVPRFIQLESQLSNSPVLWAVDVNGGLCSCTIDRSSNVYAWAYHELGGELDGEKPKVLSIAVLPSNEGRHDDLYLLVQRTINGNPQNSLERITRAFELENLYNTSTDIDDKPIFADSSILYTAGAPTTICDNLDHLEGEDVDVMGDGHYIGRFTVASGQVDVGGSKNYTEFIAGLPYTSRIVTNSLEGGSQIGSAQGLHKRAAKATLRLVRTIGLRYGLRIADLNGNDTDNMFELSFKQIGGLGGVPIPLFTGDKRLDMPLGIDRNQRIVVEQTKSLPMTVAAIFVDGQTNA